jgi:hypothetical protein
MVPYVISLFYRVAGGTGGKGKKASIHPEHLLVEGGIPTMSLKKALELGCEICIPFKDISLGDIMAVFASKTSMLIWANEIRPAMRAEATKLTRTLRARGCSKPHEDLAWVTLDTEITVLEHLTEAATTFEQHFARVGGRGSAFGKSGLVCNFMRRLELITVATDTDRSVGKRKERRTGALYVYACGGCRSSIAPSSTMSMASTRSRY